MITAKQSLSAEAGGLETRAPLKDGFTEERSCCTSQHDFVFPPQHPFGIFSAAGSFAAQQLDAVELELHPANAWIAKHMAINAIRAERRK